MQTEAADGEECGLFRRSVQELPLAFDLLNSQPFTCAVLGADESSGYFELCAKTLSVGHTWHKGAAYRV